MRHLCPAKLIRFCRTAVLSSANEKTLTFVFAAALQRLPGMCVFFAATRSVTFCDLFTAAFSRVHHWKNVSFNPIFSLIQF
jgi:hypothetical protein